MGDASPVLKTAAARKPSTNPNTMVMVVEAITALDDRKGVSVPAIKSYILSKYPSVDPNMMKHRLKQSIEKGMNDDLITRPKGSSQEAANGSNIPNEGRTLDKLVRITGRGNRHIHQGSSLNGRFHLNKVRMAAIEKAKLPKPKPKPEADNPKVKKPKQLEKAGKSPKKIKSKETKKATTKVEKTKDVKTKAGKLTKAKPSKAPAKSPSKSKDKTKIKKTDKATKAVKTQKKTTSKK